MHVTTVKFFFMQQWLKPSTVDYHHSAPPPLPYTKLKIDGAGGGGKYMVVLCFTMKVPPPMNDGYTLTRSISLPHKNTREERSSQCSQVIAAQECDRVDWQWYMDICYLYIVPQLLAAIIISSGIDIN